MNIQDIKQIIPHRHPFLLIDRIEGIRDGKAITGIKNVTFNESWFQGHFPEEPVMPGVLILEALAQTGAVLILSIKEYENKTVYLSGIDKARFYRKVQPGDTMVLKVIFEKKRGSIIKMTGQADVDGIKCASAEILCGLS